MIQMEKINNLSGVFMNSRINLLLINCIASKNKILKQKTSIFISLVFILSTVTIMQITMNGTTTTFDGYSLQSNNQLTDPNNYEISQIDPYSDIYKDFNVNQDDLIRAFNKPSLLSNGSTSDRWVDDFDAKKLNGIWNDYTQVYNGSQYVTRSYNHSLTNGKLIGTLGPNTTYSILYLNTPDFDGDFEIESKIQVTNITGQYFSLLAWDRNDNLSLTPNRYLYMGYYGPSRPNDILITRNFTTILNNTIDPSKLITDGIHLKLSYIASNQTFIGYYSFDLSSGWIYLGSINGVTIDKFNVGFYTARISGTANISYDYFSLKSDQAVHLLQTLRDNDNDYVQVWEPWLTKSAVHKAAVSDSGELMVVAGGYLLDTSLHIYRWDYYQRKYIKAFEAGSGIINDDVYDLAFGDTDNNRLMEVAAASADGHIYLFEQNHIYDPNTNLESKFDLVWKSGEELTKQVSTVDIFDADLDYLNDVIVGSYDKKVHIYEYYNHTGYPFASAEHKIDLAEKYTSPELDDVILSIASGDFNNNGLPDFIVGTRSGSVYIFENAGLVVDVRGTPTLLPWDNNYKIIANFSDDVRPLWYPVTKIETGKIDSNAGDDAVLLVWGQGTYTFQYSKSKGFTFEQLVKPFRSWESKLPYGLDNYADWMNVKSTQNVWHNINGTVVNEPACCDVEFNTNSASGYVPDGKYSHYSPSSVNNATAIYELWAGEYVTSSGNSEPDLYVILNSAQTVLVNSWTVSVTQDNENWFDIEKTSYSTTSGNTGRTLSVDLDGVFTKNRLTHAKSIKLTLDKGVSEQQVDSIFYPRAFRPLTTTTSAMIRPLKLSVNDNLINNKITFGTTDGRFLSYKYETNSAKFSYQTLTGSTLSTKYGITPNRYLEVWDSFEDDNYNLKTAIWDIFYTPKERIIPSWRYTPSSPNSVDFTSTQFGTWSTGNSAVRLHSFDVNTVYPYAPEGSVVVSTNNSIDTAEKIILISSEDGQRATLGINNFDLSHYFFDPISSYYNASAVVNELLTINFGNLNSNYGNELLVFPWFQSGRPFLTGSPLTLGDYSSVTPRIFSRTAYYNPYSSNVAIDSYIPDSGELTKFKNFIIQSNTFPSSKIVDLNHDGLSDIIVSNGTLAVLWNVGTTSSPQFIFDYSYFNEINADLVDTTIFQPQAWDYDNDGDYDIGFSYGRHSGDTVWGFDFFEQTGTNSLGDIFWSRNIQVVENPSKDGSLISNHYTLGVIVPSKSCTTASIYQSCTTGDAFWVYSPDQNTGLGFYHRLRKLEADVTSQTSFIVGTNPYVMKIEANRYQDSPNSVNMGYAALTSWSNKDEIKEWTQSLATADIDNDGKKEVIVGDYDNNVYAFEHLSNNTYKNMFKSDDLNHTETTDLSPFLFEELAGISGNFSRVIYDHTNFVVSGVDFNNDGLNGFVATSGNTVYVFEGTGYNDEIKLFLQFDIGQLFNNYAGFDPKTEKISALAVTKDFDGRGSMIAIAINNKLFLFRLDDKLGLVESFQFKAKGTGYQLPGNPFAFPKISIKSLLFADMNKDGITELWLAGLNQTSGNNGLLIALASNQAGNLYIAYDFNTADPIFTNGKTINVFTTADIDIDGNLEFVIGHSLGIDIYEFETGSPLQITLMDTITSDPTYAASRNVDSSTFEGIIAINTIAVGDTDSDLRSEILVGHDLRVSLLESFQDRTGRIFHQQVWISKSFIDKPNAISIADINGNGWPEIFVAVKGDDVYAFEVSNSKQPMASSNYLTSLTDFTSYNASASDFISYDSIYEDLNNDSIKDVVFTDSRSGGGVIAWNMATNTKMWSYTDPFGKSSQQIYLFQKGNTKSIIIVSTGGIYSLDLLGSPIYTKSGDSDSIFGTTLYVDINNDSYDELIIAYKNTIGKDLQGINTLNLETGSIIWNLSLSESSIKSFYDLKFTKTNESMQFVVSTSDFVSQKTYHFFNENGIVQFNQSSNHIDSSMTVSQSTIGDFNGDGKLDVAIAVSDINYNKLQVRTIESFDLLFEMDLKELGGSIYERVPIFAEDVNGDSNDDILLTFARFNSSDTSSSLYDPVSYKNGLIIALDINVPVVLWERKISDAIINVENTMYNNKSTLIVYTENLGVLGVDTSGADRFWTQGGTYPQSLSLSNNVTLVSSLNGFVYISEFEGILKRDDNFIQPRPNINKFVSTTLTSSTNFVKIIPVDVFNKGSDEVMLAFSNGTIKFVNYQSGEFISIQLSPFSEITANTINYDINKFGFVIKTDTSNILIFDISSNEPKKSIVSPGQIIGDIIPFNLTGGKVDSLLLQSKTTYGYMLSIYNLELNLYSWNRTYANKIISFDVGSFNGNEPHKLTHIIALDDNGVAKLIELPNVNQAGGSFTNPDVGRWNSFQTSKNSNELTDVYLGSDKGQIFRFSWNLQGSYTITKLATETLETAQNPNLLITEVMHHPPAIYSIDADWVELFNPTNRAFSLDGWYIRNGVTTNKYYLSGTITAGGYIVVARDKAVFKAMYGFEPDFEWKDDAPNLKLGDVDETIAVYSNTNVLKSIEEFGWSGSPGLKDITAIESTLVRNTTKSLANTNTDMIDSGTLGTPKNGPYNEKILISEVYFNTKYQNTNDKYEWIEVYNPTGNDVNLAGWTLKSDVLGTSLTLSGTIQSNSYFVIAKDTTYFSQLYGFEPDLTFSGSISSLVNSGDKLTLYNEEGVNLDEVGWNSYKGLAISGITAFEETIKRKSITDTDNANDFIQTGGFGDPGFGNYVQSSSFLTLSRGINNDIVLLIETSNRELIIAQDSGSFTSKLLKRTELTGTYENSIITNINGGNQEIATPFGNAILISDLNGNSLEVHSFSDIVKSIYNWNIDNIDKYVLIAELANGKLVLVDSSNRSKSCYYNNAYCATTLDKDSNLTTFIQVNNQKFFNTIDETKTDLNQQILAYLNVKNLILTILISIPPLMLSTTFALKKKLKSNKLGG
jgi:hypothetical protein